ncbi:MAG: hypothetical protein AB1941_02535 [Gemmatimonadota bacterium]
MSRVRTGFLALALAAAAGCASGGAAAGAGASGAAPADSAGAGRPASGRRDLSVITIEEIQRSGAMNAYEAVQRLRPLWLRSRNATANRGTPPSILVYLNGNRLGGTDMLRRMEVIPITSIRYLDAAAAMSLPGLASMRVEGAIMISTSRQ